MPALGVEDREAAADLAGEREQVELGAELAVITFLGLGEHLQVLVLGLPGRPGGAVDPLQLRVLLAPPPVRAAGPHQLERRDLPGSGQMRAAAQVLPDRLAGARVQVVIDGQLGSADLDALVVLGRAALEPDKFQLVWLAGQFRPCIVLGDHPARKPLALLHDAAHPLFDVLQVFGLKRIAHIEVVVEAVLDWRADAEFRIREQLLHRLREHVRRGVPQDRQAVRAGDVNRLHAVAVGERAGQVPELPADPGRYRGAGRGVPVSAVHAVAAGQQFQCLAGRRAGFHHVLASGEGDVQLLGRHWLLPWAKR